MASCMRTLSLVVALALIAAGCGSDDSEERSPGVTKVTVGFLPAIDLAFLWRAQDAGYFEEQGLQVQLKAMAGGAAITPALVGGSLDIGISDPVSLLVARGKGLDVKFFRFHRFDTPAAPDIYVTSSDPAIKSARDLAGKTVSSNVLNNQVQLVAEEWLEAAGTDPKDVKFTEVGFPDVNTALKNGSIAASSTLDPFYTIGLEDGQRLIGRPYDVVRKRAMGGALPVGGLTTTGKYAAANPDVLEAFTAAVERAFQDMADPAVQRKVWEKHLEISPALTKKITPIDYEHELYGKESTSEMLTVWNRLAAKHDAIPDGLDIDAAVIRQ